MLTTLLAVSLPSLMMSALLPGSHAAAAAAAAVLDASSSASVANWTAPLPLSFGDDGAGGDPCFAQQAMYTYTVALQPKWMVFVGVILFGLIGTVFSVVWWRYPPHALPRPSSLSRSLALCSQPFRRVSVS
jgi:hypothetical protein